jgi:heme exporter protein C
VGLAWGLFFSPPDYQQGDFVRIMYVHVPFAWLSSAGYACLGTCSIVSIVSRHPLADVAAKEIAPVGASFTAVCLITGALWGKPTWGAWWVWDARLTSVFLLFLLYLGHITIVRAFDDQQKGFRAASILGVVGLVNLPIIKFSVTWWNTLHQPASITLTDASSIASPMLWPLAFTMIGYTVIFTAIVLDAIGAAILEARYRSIIANRFGQGCA